MNEGIMNDEPINPQTEQEAIVPEAKAKTKAAINARTPRAGSKLEIIAKMLRRKHGCTTKEVMEACEWPAVSMPQQAKALGIKLKTEKTGRTTRYWAA